MDRWTSAFESRPAAGAPGRGPPGRGPRKVSRMGLEHVRFQPDRASCWSHPGLCLWGPAAGARVAWGQGVTAFGPRNSDPAASAGWGLCSSPGGRTLNNCTGVGRPAGKSPCFPCKCPGSSGFKWGENTAVCLEEIEGNKVGNCFHRRPKGRRGRGAR